jgi:hypothetical protein
MAHTLPDGRLMYPQRGSPPRVPDGYDRDPTNPFIMIPCYEDCSQRTTSPVIMPCGKVNHRPWCKLHNCEATPLTCESCPDIDYISSTVATPSPVGRVHDCSIEQSVTFGNG